MAITLSVGQCRNILKHIKQGEARYAEIEVQNFWTHA